MEKVNELLRLFDIKTKKKYGQNFLVDDTVIDRIISAADISKEDMIIEIGSGIGNLTRRLCEDAYLVIAVEVDDSLRAPLEYNLQGIVNHVILFSDIMKIDILNDIIIKYDEKRDHRIKVVANLPYYIAASIIIRLVSENTGIGEMVFMVQKEVAERICAEPGGREYGILSIAVQAYADASILFDVPGSSFTPVPKVDSSVIKIIPYIKEPFDINDYPFFFKIIKAAFSQRRKTAANAIYSGLDRSIPKARIESILTEICGDPMIRAERISIGHFSAIAKSLKPLF